MSPSSRPPAKDPSAGPSPDAELDPDDASLEADEDPAIEEDDEDDDEDEDVVTAPVSAPPRPASRPSPPRPWGGNRGAVSPEDLSPEELTPEMRWPPGSWVKVTDVIRHSTGEPIESIAVGDVGQVTAALSQTLVVLFPTRDNRREVLHIDSIEAVEP